MSQFVEIRPSVGKVVLHSIAALVLGLLQPLAVMFQVILPMPGISLAMLAAAAFYGSTGIVPVVVLGISAAVSQLFIYGTALGTIAMVIWLIPTAMILAGIRRREPFFRQMVKAVAAAVIAMVVAAVVTALVYGSDVISLAVDQMRATFGAQEQMFYEILSPVFEGASFEDFVEAYYVMFNTLELYYEYYLLSNLIGGAIISAAVSVLWGNWKVAQRGGATAESYLPLGRWYLPANTTWGLMLMLAAGFVLSKTKIPGAQSAWVLVGSLSQTAFLIQCMAALDRRMKKNGSGHVARTAMILLLFVLCYMWGSINVLAILGAVSALFGSKGAAKPLIAKFNEKTDGEGR